MLVICLNRVGFFFNILIFKFFDKLKFEEIKVKRVKRFRSRVWEGDSFREILGVGFVFVVLWFSCFIVIVC